MARRVYFAFDYRDIFKVNQIRRSGEFVPSAVAGFTDASQWEKLKQRQDRVIEAAIDAALERTSVTVVCVGERTASRRWVRYELTESRRRGNGLLGVYLPDESGHPKPPALRDAPLYRWSADRFSDWVEDAYLRSG